MKINFFYGNPGFDDGNPLIENLKFVLKHRESDSLNIAICYSMGAFDFLRQWSDAGSAGNNKVDAVVWIAPFLYSNKAMSPLARLLLGNGFTRYLVAKLFYRPIATGFIHRMFDGNDLLHVAVDRYVQRLQSPQVWANVLRRKYEQETSEKFVISSPEAFPKLFVVLGGNDQIVSEVEVRQQINRLGLNAAYEVFSECGHGLIFTKSRELALKIGEFLK